MKKQDIAKIIAGLKSKAKVEKKPERKVPMMEMGLGARVRDMRQEAMDIGAHGAKECWGGDAT